MVFGISFGKKKQSGTQTTQGTQTTDLTGSQSQTSVQQGTTQTTTNQSGTQQTTGTTTGQTTQNQTQGTQGTQSTRGITTSLGQDVIDALTASVGSVLGSGVTPENIARLSEMISGRTGFDANQFIESTVGAARNRGEQTLQESTSAFSSAIGGNAQSNTMAALLAQRGRNDLEANLANIRAQATAQAEGIQNQNLQTAVGAQGELAGIGAALSEALKGGVTTTDTTSLVDEISRLVGAGTSTQSVNQNVTTQSSESSTTNQLLSQIAQILTQQRENTVMDETITQKGKSGGFGLGIGI